MSVVKSLKEAKSLTDLAKILNYKPSGLSAILYHIPDANKYTEFSIPKQSGGLRTIKAPVDRLNLLQKRLSDLLYSYLDEIEPKKNGFKTVSHGFIKDRSIITNAQVHKRRRYVLNIDLNEFFSTINFGRVRGIFIKDKRFEFHQDVATIIAQIACHANSLPQGSPCSPIISNIVGRLLDVRLIRLARLYKCTYSRYADDITFSTNRAQFPSELAHPDPAGSPRWVLGFALTSEITNRGFQVNNNKTRMQFKASRQLVTGLIVNDKVNIKQEYYRNVRSMCSLLFKSGKYYRVTPAVFAGGSANDPPVKVEFDTLGSLGGMLSYVYHVKNTIDRRASVEKKKEATSAAIRKLYHLFLFYKNFVDLKSPLIVTEGKTDAIYLKSAVEMLSKFHPQLGSLNGGKFVHTVRYLKFTSTVRDVLQLGGGSSDIKFFIERYAKILRKFKHGSLSHPVIILIDNDEGAKDIFSVVRGNTPHKDISLDKTDKFYRIYSNLYLVKTPEVGKVKNMTCIESFFEDIVLKTVLETKTLDLNKKHLAPGKYGKQVFAEKVVRPNKKSINFSGFDPLLERIVAVIDDYKTNPSSI
ncbi:retron Ec67 family RNA-directed DNA polymerase/endonuclease [Methylobacterium sp. J-059]|uniref:retron Ec67 family RNA-directed DNA polymerase/endonuclease n=1 Tax=Methylobacterium sp. J-059 TaxID=2836643 RepID=UPI001FBBB640|nr:retron Ec67 family RNA-directed DNA polymerase/endonuclease [Methylobacterium sp. J-059]MCJ2042242.1 retron Ec67 family RNA-directed DNA polymerase/endonuclease [Methylobacterium sp. J-059]